MVSLAEAGPAPAAPAVAPLDTTELARGIAALARSVDALAAALAGPMATFVQAAAAYAAPPPTRASRRPPPPAGEDFAPRGRIRAIEAEAEARLRAGMVETVARAIARQERERLELVPVDDGPSRAGLEPPAADAIPPGFDLLIGKLPKVQRAVYETLAAAAAAGAPCPTGDELGAAGGFTANGQASLAVQRIERKGLIEVVRDGPRRKVTIRATGASTDWTKENRGGRPSRRLNPTQSVVYAELARAAQAGERCPGNRALAELTGLQELDKVGGVVAALERKGLIAVARGHKWRQVTIVATGARTAAMAPSSAIASVQPIPGRTPNGYPYHGHRTLAEVDGDPTRITVEGNQVDPAIPTLGTRDSDAAERTPNHDFEGLARPASGRTNHRDRQGLRDRPADKDHRRGRDLPAQGGCYGDRQDRTASRAGLTIVPGPRLGSQAPVREASTPAAGPASSLDCARPLDAARESDERDHGAPAGTAQSPAAGAHYLRDGHDGRVESRPPVRTELAQRRRARERADEAKKAQRLELIRAAAEKLRSRREQARG